MIRRILARLTGDGRRRTIADLRERQIIGILTMTGNPDWDARLNRTLALPSGIHLWTLDSTARDTPEGQMKLRLRRILLNEPAPSANDVLALPTDGSLTMLAGDDEVHSWNLTNLFQRMEDGDEQAAEDLLELELHVQQRAIEATMHGFEASGSVRWPDEAT
jgi:hypothetical protein